jgi:hypothetical protein
VERLGRRTLFLISEIGMTISMFALGAFFFIKEDCEKTLESTPESDCQQQVSDLGSLNIRIVILYITNIFCYCLLFIESSSRISAGYR